MIQKLTSFSRYLAQGLFYLWLIPLTAAATPPVNDDLKAALVMASLPYSHQQSTQEASLQTGELSVSCGPSTAGGSVWYQYSSTKNQVVLVETTGSDYNPVVSVWSGTPVPVYEEACSADNAVPVVLKLAANTTYYLNIQNSPGEGGNNLLLNVKELTSPLNDELDQATPMISLPYHHTQTTLGATVSPHEVVASCGDQEVTGGASVWYLYTPTKNQTVKFDTVGSNYPTLLSVWQGASYPLAEMACSSLFPNNVSQSQVSVTLSANMPYYVNIRGQKPTSGTLLLNAEEVLAPSNDDLAQALNITALPYHNSQSAAGATLSQGEAQAGCGTVTGGTVWYQYMPSSNHWLSIDTFGADYDTVLSVWDGSAYPLTEVACNNDQGEKRQSQVMFPVTLGVPYYISVGSVKEISGTLNLNVQAVTSPANAQLATALTIPAVPYSYSQNTQGATVFNPDAVSQCGTTGLGVWYQYTPSSDQQLVIDTADSDYQAIVSVWSGMVNSATETVCGPTTVTVSVTANVTYYININDVGETGGSLVLKVQEQARPSNDNLENATAISPLPYHHTQATLGATRQMDVEAAIEEAVASCSTGFDSTSIWYQYTPSKDEALVVDTIGSDYDTVVSVWTGTTHPLEEVACHNDIAEDQLQSQLLFSLTANVTYYINVNGGDEENHTLVLNAQAVALPGNDNLEQAVVISALPFTQTQTTFGATTEYSETGTRMCMGTDSTVWYQYTPTTDQQVMFDTLGSDYPIVFSVWTGAGYHPLQEAGCSHSKPDVVSEPFILDLNANWTYFISVGGVKSAAGNLVFHAQVVTSPAQDSLDNLLKIDKIPYRQAYSTLGATQSLEETMSRCGGNGAGVWYEYTPTQDQALELNTFGSDYDTVLSVFTGVAPSLTELACNDNRGDILQSQVSLKLTAGMTYYVNLSSQTNRGGNLVFNVNKITSPTNDDMAQPLVISEVPYHHSQNTQGASVSAPEESISCTYLPGAGVWYQYTPTEDGLLVLDTFGSQYDTVLTVWDETQELVCQEYVEDVSGEDVNGEDVNGEDVNVVEPQSAVTSQVEANMAYHFNVSGVNGDSGNLVLNVNEIPRPHNDDIGTATTVSALPYQNTQSVQWATLAQTEITSSCSAGAVASVWYQYTPSSDQVVRLDTFTSDYDTVLSVWSGTPESLMELACSNDEASQLQSQLSLALTGQTTYYVNISNAGEAAGTLVFNFSEQRPPSNDGLVQAQVITSLPYTQTQSVYDATLEAEEVMPTCAIPVGSVWYQYVPTSDQVVRINTLGSDYDTVISVWTGTLSAPIELACNDNEGDSGQSQVDVTLIAGTPYYLNVGSVNSTMGQLTMNLSLLTVPDNDAMVRAVTIPGPPYSHSQNTRNATLEEGEALASCGSADASVWYQYTPSVSQNVIVDTLGSNYNTVLSVWTGSELPLTEVACQDDVSGSLLQSQLTVALTAGTTYFINVAGVTAEVEGNRSGGLVFTLQESPAPMNVILPELGQGQAMDAQGNAVSTTTQVGGGISVNGSEYQLQVIQNLSDTVDVWGKMTVESAHIGATADIVVYAGYKPSPEVEEEMFFMLGKDYLVLLWDQTPANLVAFSQAILASEQWIHLYSGQFILPGVLRVFFGYRLPNGTIVTNPQGIEITILEAG